MFNFKECVNDEVSEYRIKSKLRIFSNSFQAHAKRICSILIIPICILGIMKCEAVAAALHSDPEDLEYHVHDLMFRVKAFNHSQDTLGVRELVLPLYGYSYYRPEIDLSDKYYFFFYDFPETLYIEIPSTDTAVCIYETKINHFIGYQKENNGNTARYSCLDCHDGWRMFLWFSEGCVVLDSGDSLISERVSLEIPDRVKTDKGLDIKIEFDLKDLFSLRDDTLYFRGGHINFLQM